MIQHQNAANFDILLNSFELLAQALDILWIHLSHLSHSSGDVKQTSRLYPATDALHVTSSAL